MPAHQRVQAWIAQNYRRPAIDQEWLADCSDWLTSELGLDPSTDFDQFVQHVEAQLLQSNLADSTVPGSGIDPLLVTDLPRRSSARRRGRQTPRQKKTTGTIPLLVEIKSVTEIAHSAFNLLNTHQMRLDRADLGLAHEEYADQPRDEDDGPVPKFPRGMLRFELSDGLTAFRAIEFRSLPQLDLDTTPLGYKLFLTSTPIRNGIAFLEPTNVILKGYRTEDHDVNKEQVFLSSLRKRLGRPDPPTEAPNVGQPQVKPPSQRQHQAPLVARPPSPPADIDDDEVDPDVLREAYIQMDEAIEVQETQRACVHAPPLAERASITKPTLHLNTTIASSSRKSSPSGSSRVKASSYFTARSCDSVSIPDIGLSPRPNPEPDLDDTLSPKSPVAVKHNLTSTRTKHVYSSGKRSSSPDPFDDLSFDMDVDESFFEQVGMIEQNALCIGTNNKGKGKGKDPAEGTSCSRLSAASRKMPFGSAVGTKPLAMHPVSRSAAERDTTVQGSTNKDISPSSLSDSLETPMPQSTQSSRRYLPCDPSLIVISSEDDAPGEYDMATPLDLPRERVHKRRRNQDDVVVSDVIDISD